MIRHPWLAVSMTLCLLALSPYALAESHEGESQETEAIEAQAREKVEGERQKAESHQEKAREKAQRKADKADSHQEKAEHKASHKGQDEAPDVGEQGKPDAEEERGFMGRMRRFFGFGRSQERMSEQGRAHEQATEQDRGPEERGETQDD